MKTRYRSRLSGEFFQTEEEVIEHLEKEGIEDHFEAYYDVISLSKEDIAELEKDFRKYCEKNPDDPNCNEYFGKVDDTPDPNIEPSEIDSLSESELLDRIRAKVSVDQYLESELTPTQEKQLLSRLLGVCGDKSVDKKAHDKVFAPSSTTKTAFKDHYTNVIRDLQDESKISCPQCGQLWSTIAEDLKENLAYADQHKELEGKFPILRIHHMKTKHIAVWNLIADLFGIPEKRKLPHEQVTWTSNPESVSATETPEEFSKEELSEAISSSPELRRQFFRKWLEKLKKRE